MAAVVKKEIALEIADVLFVDVVGYSKLSINEQHAAVAELTQVVRATEQFQKAEAAALGPVARRSRFLKTLPEKAALSQQTSRIDLWPIALARFLGSPARRPGSWKNCG
jgi:hypothetical protein